MLDGDDFDPSGRFELRRRLGVGGMGVVYEAFDRERQLLVALKTLKRLDPQTLFRFKREFRALQDLSHPNLARLGELIEWKGNWFFTLELVRGTDLLRYLRHVAGGSSDALDDVKPARIRAVFVQLARGLVALHQAGRYHRDIKPSNVLVGEDGRVVIVDFGLVTEHGDIMDSTGQLVVGTPAYMAPEQAAGKAAGPEADWYAYGVMLYEILAWRLPYDGNPLEIAFQKQQYLPLAPEAPEDGDPERKALVRLCMRLLAIDPKARPSAAEVLTTLGDDGGQVPLVSGKTVTQSVPFVGRREELEVLRRAYANASKGAASFVLVTGESGMGKTELVGQFVAGLGDLDDPPVVLSGRCYERESVPYKAFDGLADSLSRHLVRLPEAEAALLMPRRGGLLGRLFPVLGRVPVVSRMWEPDAVRIDPQELRLRMFTAFRELLERLRDRRKVVLVIDDLQWTDADSLVLLEDLLRAPSPPPLLVVATARATAADELERLVPPALRGMVTAIPVTSLPAEQARELAKLLAPSLVGEQPSTLDALVAEGAGHPLFLQELARRTSFAPGAQGSLRLEDVLRDRIAQLPAEARTLLEILAVAGAPLARSVAAATFGDTAMAFDRALSVLRVASLARTSGSDATRVETYHDRIRDAALVHLGEQRQAYHRRLADALEWAGAARTEPQVLVRHLEAAGESTRAAVRAHEAARLAMDVLAFERAAELYETALRLGDYKGAAKHELLFAWAAALANAGRGPAAADRFLEAAEGAVGAPRIDLLSRAAEQLFMSGHHERATLLVGELFAAKGLRMPRTPRGALALLLLERLRLRVRGYEWRPRAQPEGDLADAGYSDPSFSFAFSHGHVEPVLGSAHCARWVRVTLDEGVPQRVVPALCLEASYLSAFGPRGRARAKEILESLRKTPVEAMAIEHWIHMSNGVLDYFEGRFQASIPLMRLAEESVRDGAAPLAFLNLVRAQVLFGLLHAGRLRELGQQFHVYLHDAERRGDLHMETTSKRVCSLVWLARGLPDEARRLLAETRWIPPEGLYHLQHWYELEANVQIVLFEGRVAEQLDTLRAGLAACERSLLGHVEIVGSLRDWLEARLLLAAVTGQAQRGRLLRRIRRCAARLRRVSTPFGSVWAHLVEAGLARQGGDDAGAVAALRETIAAAEGNMTSCAAVARYRLSGLVEGPEREAALASARGWAESEGVVDLERFAEVLAPGFSPAARWTARASRVEEASRSTG